MDGRHIIPVPAANDGAPAVVVEVRQNGSRPLDVRLVGCEGENPYVTTLKQRSIGDLKKKGSDEEWEIILSHFLLQKQPEKGHAAILDGIRMDYAPKGKDIHITIWRDVQGIKMTLGDFELRREPEEEIDPIDWAYTSAQAHNLALQEMAQLRAKAEGEQGTIDKLNAQLQDFIKTKNETETAMLQQFMELLNEKKRKIRDQSRILAGAKVDKATASAVQSTREEIKCRKPVASRASKRKAPVKQEQEQDESDSDQMEIDQSKEEERDESEPEAATPDRSTDDETEDEGDAVSARDSLPSSQLKGITEPGPSKAAAAPRALPPKRELPFNRRPTRNTPSVPEPKPTAPEDDEDEGTDDEEL